jgi:Kef-type K+ transport system membrane component KefB/voltage-gated potassium channel Kch
MEEIFIQLGAILFIAFIVSYVARMFKQPIIIGYILAGIIISPFLIMFGATTEVVDVFSKLGIAFLLFIVGLHMNPKIIKEIGVQSLLIGLAQIVLTFGVGFLVAFKVLNYSLVASSYVGIALAFSSTIIIMKLLSDKRHLDSLYGKISIGILIIQDLVAVGVLMFISSFSQGSDLSSFAVRALLSGTGLIVILFLLGFFVIPRLMKSVAKSQELLFLFSVCWCFLVAALFSYFGFSIEIGALIAGVVLSLSPYSVEISSRIRPLRDFFLIIFFIILGLNVQFSNFNVVIVNALILSLIVLVLKPIIIMFMMRMFRYTKRTNFLVGTSLAQISEFSLIVLLMGVAVGHISSEILQTLTLTLIITILFSTYMMVYSKKFYKKMSGFASLFEKKKFKKEKRKRNSYSAILFGYNRVGFSILNSLKKIGKRYLVVDFNPDTITNLNKFKIPCLYGDVDDPELLNELPLEKIEIAVSTVPDFDTNFLLIESIRMVNPNAIIVVRASSIQDALELYHKGANYVLTPHFLGGAYVSDLIRHLKTSEKGYDKEREKHIKMLKEIKEKTRGKIRLSSHESSDPPSNDD